jgi:hypothetical protein
MKKFTVVLFQIAFAFLFSATAAPALDVAAMDHNRILSAANDALKLAPLSITQFHPALSTDRPHDYYSNGDYWWPNPNTTNGLPYVQRDGQTNPKNFNDDRDCLRQMNGAVAALAAAYQITGDDRYAAKAAELLRIFFLAPATRMNPNLQYAQAIPGVSPGRGTGIIDTLHLIEVPRAIAAIEKSPAFPPGELSGLKKWFSDYVTWMRTSKNGNDEANASNNHAVAYWLQVAVFAQFSGDQKNLDACRKQFKGVFVTKQMATDGSFPRELTRTKPYGYSTFQLGNMVTLCQVLSTPQDNLWQFQLPDGRGIQKAVEFMYPYLADKNKWLADGHRKDIQAWDGWPSRQPLLLFAGLAFHDQKYLDLWNKLSVATNPEVRRNTAITQPILWVQN